MEPIESWRRVWRVAAPLLSTKALHALKEALQEDSPHLLQGATTSPPTLLCTQDWPVESACLFGLCGVVENGDFGTATVGEVAEYFAQMMFTIDQELGEPAGCRHLLHWFDDVPRSQMIAELLPEVELALAQREDK